METELKLNAERLKDPLAVLSDPYLAHLILPDPIKTTEMDSRYYDTAEKTLKSLGCSLRLRRENQKILLTIKSTQKADQGLHQRLEWSIEMPDKAGAELFTGKGLDLQGFIRSAGREGDRDERLYEIVRRLKGKPLLELCQVTFTRIACDVGYGDTRMELALDRGILKAGGRMAPFCEFELELKEGDVRDLMALGQEMAHRYDLQPENRSKLARCLALIGEENDG